ncbi:MAG: hypothetical protein AAGF95_27990 [Chloroflexota bacterium]
MFNILCLSIEDELASLNTLQDQIDQQDIPWKRKATTYFIPVFATVRELEMALDATVCELESIAIDGEVPNRVILRNKIANLRRRTDAFGETLIRLYSSSSLRLESNYNNKMLLSPRYPETLDRNEEAFARYVKSLRVDQQGLVHLYSLSCPSILVENKRATYFVEYLLEPPDALAIQDAFNTIHQDDSALSRVKEHVLRHMRERMQFETVDVRNRDVLRSAIADAREEMARIVQSRQVLAQMIKHCFPLDTILT